MTKRKNHRHPLLWSALLAILLLTPACTAPRSSGAPDRHAMARYYYLAGVEAQGTDHHAEAYEYYRKAHQLDPDYREAAFAYACARMEADIDTLQSPAQRAITASLMRPLVDANPLEYDEVLFYAAVAEAAGQHDEAARVLERTDSLFPRRTETLLQLYPVYSKNQQFDKAIDALTRFEKREGASPQLTVQKCVMHLAQKDTLAAIGELDALIARNPRDPVSLVMKGSVLESLSRPDSARVYFQLAETADPNYAPAKLALADLYREQGDSAAYDAKIYDALLSESMELEEKVQLLGKYISILLSNNYDRKRGDHLFEVLSRQYPHSPEVRALSAEYSAAKDNLKSAIEEISYAVDQEPSVENYHYKLMRFLLADNRPQEAMQAFDRARKHLDPTPPMLFAYAAAAGMAKDYHRSIATYDTLIHRIVPELPVEGRLKVTQIPRNLNINGLETISEYFCSIGDNYQNLDSMPAAYDAYENALLFDPQNSVVLNNYAFALATKGGDLEKALELSRRSLDNENYKENSSHLDTYAWILHLSGNNKEARAVQADAVKFAQTDRQPSAELYIHYADILLADGAPDEALLYYEKALKIEPDNKTIIEKIKSLKK